MPTAPTVHGLHRRAFMTLCSGLGLGGALSSALWREARAQGTPPAGGVQTPQAPGRITREMLTAAEILVGLEFTDAERELMLPSLNAALDGYAALRKMTLDNAVGPAIRFDPGPPPAPRAQPKPAVRPVPHRPSGAVTRPATPEALAFASVSDLGALLRARTVTSEELTTLYLDRLKRHNPELLCVVNLTEERALRQARQADADLKAGRDHGPLHGIPWGAKDLLAVPGYPTTWGSPIFKDQMLPAVATVVERLDAAGAVLVAKLSLGEFAQGDVWYGGTTKNPWKTDQGSSGSSAGPASATAAGCVAFAIGSETQGSIISPSTRCGVTGLRPTFGRVSRAGAMALSWTMDKLGPLARTASDCGMVLDVIRGVDGRDPTVTDRPFDWRRGRGLAGLRVGYLKSAFDAAHATKPFDDAALEVLRRLGANLISVDLTTDLPVGALGIILTAEASAAFDEITRSGRDDQMVQQTRGAWPNTFRRARFIPAVEYIQANRVRALLVQRVNDAIRDVDVFVTPSFGGNIIQTTNLTGHPALVMPNGFNPDGTPVSISFIGQLFGEAALLAVGEAYQDASGFHLKHPPRFS